MAVTVATPRRPNALGDALRYLRERAGLSQVMLAKASGVDRSYISMLENGRRTNVSHEVATSLARALGVTLEELYRLTGRGWVDADMPPPTAVAVNDPEKVPILRRLGDLPVEGLLQLERIWRIIHLESVPSEEVRRAGEAEQIVRHELNSSDDRISGDPGGHLGGVDERGGKRHPQE